MLAFDQITKYWISVKLREGDEIDIIRGFFKLSYTENPGIAFGMLNNGNVKWLLVSVSIAAVTVVVYYMARTPRQIRSCSGRCRCWRPGFAAT